MRNKLIAVYAVIVLIVGLLAFFTVKAQLSMATSSPELLHRAAHRDALQAATKFQLDALRVERWLVGRAADPATRAVISRATADGRTEAARRLADQLANAAPAALGTTPSIVAVVDANGKLLARNGSDLGRGDDVGSVYPAFKDATAKLSPGSDVWADAKRADQFIASYAPMSDENGRAMMLVVGVPLNDALAHVAEPAGGRGTMLVSKSGIVLAGTQLTDDLKRVAQEAASDIQRALGSSGVVTGGDRVGYAVAPLDGFGFKSAAVISIAPTSLVEGAASIPFSILGAMLLGLVLVIASAQLLGNYISRPIASLEEGLLQILNGQPEKRFELDHAELGGLAFRIDQLLNQLMGVEEDTTDEEGRVSKAPSDAAIREAYAVEPGVTITMGGPPQAGEPEDQYHKRLFAEYTNAKRSIGEVVDHISFNAFRTRMQDMEREASLTQGRKVRYQVQISGREVVLIAVPV